jgi:RHS repeat-associated protein
MTGIAAVLLRNGRAAVILAVGVALSVAVFDAPASDREQRSVSSAGPPAASGGGPLGREIVAERTRNSKTFQAANGHGLVTRVYSGAVHYRGGQGDWTDIDNTVELAGPVLRNRRNGYRVELPQRFGAVKVAEGGKWLSFDLNGARDTAAVAQGNRATFPDALPGVDLRYSAQASSLKEEILLAGPDAPSSFSFDIAGSDGLTARKTEAGAIEFEDAAGETAFALPPPYMFDANRDEPRASSAVSYDLEQDGSGWTLRVRASRKWLEDDERQWPVTIDPTVSFSSANRDCALDEGTPGTNSCDSTNLWAGKDAHDHRAILDFDVAGSIPKDAVVLNARLSLWEGGSTRGVAKNLGVYRMTRQWQEGATWNTRDGTNAWTTSGGEFDSTKHAETSVGGGGTGYRHWHVTKLVQSWVDGSNPDYGLMLKDSDAAPVDNEVSFLASEDPWAAGRPALEVRWEPRVGEGSSYTYNGEQLNDRTGYKVNVANGNLELASSDINVAGTELDLSFDRYYNSGWGHWYQGQFGGGGTANMGKDAWLDTSASPDLTKMVYLGTGSAYPYFKKPGVNEWDLPETLGLNADLRYDATNNWMELKYRGSDLKYIFGGDPTSGGTLKKIRDRNNNQIIYNYDAGGYLDSIVDTQGKTLDVSVNASGFISQIQDPSGRLWKYQYGTGVEWNLLKKYTDPNGKDTLYEWDGSANLLTKVTTPGGRQTKFEYWPDRKLKKVIRVDNVVAQTGPTTTYDYYVGGGPCQADQNRTVVTDPRGKPTTYCSSQKDDRVAKVRDAKNHDQSTEFTPFGNVQQLTRPGSPSNSVSSLNWETGTNNLTGGQSPTGGAFDFTYNEATTGQKHQPHDYVNPQGGGQRMAYDSKGNVTGIAATKQGPGGRTDRLLEAEKATLTYNADGTIATASDGRDNAGFDTTWTYTYTGGNLTKVTPPTTSGGGITQLGETILTYDSLSRIKTIRDGKLQTRTFTYDGLDRVTGVELKNSAGTVLASEAAVYDNDGNMTTRTEWESPSTTRTTTVEYDALNRMKKETLPGAKTNEYTYDLTGNVTSVKTNGSDTVSYTYDDVNLLAKLIEPPDVVGGAAPETVFDYDERNNRKSVLYPNGVEVRQTFFGDDTVDAIEAKKGTNVLRKFSYTYTKGTQQTDLRQTVTTLNGAKTVYDYDHLDRLKRAETRSSAGALVDDYVYSYDPASNITRKTKQVGAGAVAVTSYAHNQANQLCWLLNGSSTNPCGTAPTGATSFGYDASGNATSGNRAYAYNIKGQTTTITGTGLVYLGLTQDELTGVGSDTFQNAGVGITQHTSGASTYRHRRDPGGQLLGTKHPTGRYYMIWDALGSTVAITDGAGAVVNSYSYEPYGTLASSSGTLPNPFKFAGGHDTGVGVYHFGARQYDPSLGRWTQLDPLDQAGDLQEGNRYAYAGLNPINAADPSGQFRCWDMGTGICKRTAGLARGAGRAIVEYDNRRRNPEQYHRLTRKTTTNQVCGIVTVSGNYAAGIGCYVAGLR